MAPAAIVSSIVEGTSRQLEGTFSELESTFGKLEGTFGKLESVFVGVEIVSIKQETPISGVEGAWAGSCLLRRAHVTIGTSPRVICYEPAVMIARVGIMVNRVAAMPITLSEIAMDDMAWVTGVAQTARGAVTPHCDVRRPTTTSTHKPHPNIEAPSQPSPRGRSATQPPQTQQEGTPALWGGLGIGFQ